MKGKMTMKSEIKIVAVALTLFALAACGQNMPEQTVLGAGAGVGAAVVLSGGVAAGAIVGAAGNVAYCKTYPDRCR
ncbi:hypothetical protein NO357_09240 [Marimonas arenosa]|uniref:Lipoprotein n=1 Tax=Marimonas arenosa TaxID=1795305 RepID=A0AAE4B4C1_9RHOB|nr:hypothetical protein [Marimonas arenosa]